MWDMPKRGPIELQKEKTTLSRQRFGSQAPRLPKARERSSSGLVDLCARGRCMSLLARVLISQQRAAFVGASS